jgi:hypothetical protein
VGIHWINVTEGKDKLRYVVNTAASLWAPGNTGNLLPSQASVSFSRRILPHRDRGVWKEAVIRCFV